MWAPVGAAITIMLRPAPDESLPRRAFTAAAMFLPIAMWLGFRLAVFGGIGGTYGTAGYTPLASFLNLTFHKLKHIHRLFVGYDWGRSDQTLLGLVPALLVYMLLSLLPLHILSETVNRVRCAMREMRWPTVDMLFLVTLWAAIALAFHFALPLLRERYATSLVVFAWPALVAVVAKHRKTIIWVGLAVCCLMSLTTASYSYVAFIVNSPLGNDDKLMRAELRQVPAATRQIYVLPHAGILHANFKYVGLVLGVPAEMVRVVDIRWNCGGSSDFVASNHSTTYGIVNLTVTLPACASFDFDDSSLRLNEATVINGHLFRKMTQ